MQSDGKFLGHAARTISSRDLVSAAAVGGRRGGARSSWFSATRPVGRRRLWRPQDPFNLFGVKSFLSSPSGGPRFVLLVGALAPDSSQKKWEKRIAPPCVMTHDLRSCWALSVRALARRWQASLSYKRRPPRIHETLLRLDTVQLVPSLSLPFLVAFS